MYMYYLHVIKFMLINAIRKRSRRIKIPLTLLKYKKPFCKRKPPFHEICIYFHNFFSCFFFRPDFPSLNSVGLLKHDYVIVTAENSEFIAVCAGSITDISEEEVVLLTERYIRKHL